MGGRALLVIDMLRDFLDERGALDCGDRARAIIPFVREKVTEFKTKAEPVIFICDAHDPDDREFMRFPAHCVRGSEGARLHEYLESASDGEYVVYKKRFSGFYGTSLDELLKKLAPEEVHVVGVCTNICVLYTVEELCNRDIPAVVYRDGVAALDEEAHRLALVQMEGILGAELR